MKPPVFEIVETGVDRVLVRDVGPWDRHLTVTNGAEYVVEELSQMLRGRRLEYYDSEGNISQLLIKDGKFAGFGFSEERG